MVKYIRCILSLDKIDFSLYLATAKRLIQQSSTNEQDKVKKYGRYVHLLRRKIYFCRLKNKKNGKK